MWTLVSGASRGIGKEVCMELARRGHKVIALSRSELPFAQRNILPLKADAENYASLRAVGEFFRNEKISFSLVVHNAATLLNKPFEHIRTDELEKVFRVNVFAPFVLTQMLVPLMTEQSHLVMISSMGGFQGSAKFSGLTAYSSSKAALANLAECLAEELKSRKIFVNSLHLGAVRTEMFRDAFPGHTAPVDAASMAEFIVWFGLNGHRWFNGKCIPVSCSTP